MDLWENVLMRELCSEIKKICRGGQKLKDHWSFA